ncbi:hypothetical protein B2G71_04475 [Novosphingobium sp. PC22D]|uniref:TonB-dependent receptor n=1 Tax=Novosphingobium sp. PC22D TaxID=1962403 RepID=UPI000BF17F36|nr:TonB-dependent receptor [Novosphingobium sp. PC22D]PEQ13592.1 hypothetical protein B2G71_04475 [Novosphingobium sp. PC22D]
MKVRYSLPLTAAGLLFACPAMAQERQGDPASDTPQQASSAPGDIIVTARRREESILRVPVVATVLTAETLERQQVDDLYSVAGRVPGFIMAESVGTVGIQASLRGIGPTSQTPSVDQSVSLNVDGLQLTQGFAYAAAMFDVGGIEVLKGPQALFFGKNSPAGVISIRSADPTDEFELITRLGYEAEAEEKLGELIVSGPVSPTLGLRFAGRFSDSEGFFRNNGVPIPNTGNVAPKYRKFAPKRSYILKGTALWEPSDSYSARLKLNFVDDRTEGNGGDGQLVYCPDGTGGVPPLNIPFIGDADCTLDRYTQLGDFDPAFWPNISNGGVPYMDSRQYFGTLEQNLDVTPAIRLTSITGGYSLRQNNLIRGSGSSNPTIAADFEFRNRQFTQELRLASDFVDSPVNFTLGGFYQYAKFESDNNLRANTAFGLPPILQSARHQIRTYSASAFGQLLWKLSDQLEIGGGARFTNEIRRHTEQNGLAGYAEVDLLVPRIEANNLSPEFSVTWTPTDDFTVFGSYRQGFKSGSFNTIVFIDENTRADFGEEKAKGGEIGIKTRLFDRSLLFNLAAYRYTYSDLQVGANEVSPTGGIILRTVNAASARVQGIEADATFYPRGVPGLSLRAAVNYNHARYLSFPNAPCGNGQTIAQGCDQLFNPATGRFTSQDLEGEPLVRAPDWSGNVGVDYEGDAGPGLTFGVGASAVYSSSFQTNLVGYDAYRQGEYAKLNLNLSLRSEDGWEVSMIGNNLTNEITAALCSNSNTQNGTVFGGQLSGAPNQGPAGGDELGCVAERGRELWLRMTFRLSDLFSSR